MNANTIGNYKCPCCGFYTLNEKADNTFQICPVCYWEDDGVQLHEPDYEGGANNVSLMQAKENFYHLIKSCWFYMVLLLLLNISLFMKKIILEIILVDLEEW